jgi:hypothetical protein
MIKKIVLISLMALSLLSVNANAGLMTNIALGGSASQSSTGWGGSANRAIDGNTSGNYGHGSSTHTNNDSNAWWEVDLGQMSYIDDIVLWNRTGCCSYRLNYFNILLDNVLVAHYDETNAPSPTFKLSDLGLIGQVVRVQFDGSGRNAGQNYLTLAEVQVSGTQDKAFIAQAQIPEPSTIAIFALGLIAIASRKKVK